ncbi:MAG: phosphate ABC transporter permease subunit PstC [Elusimicrobia bacterium RIFOXYB2_FULL_49_7]|nr:MAG: phosphate ABC transporter permease subunit PstC [Elusimicrobia bacterium RIFOXYB2_FULL_49_7]
MTNNKKNKLLEFFIEKSMAVIALFSLLFIALIFIFVFREAASVFFVKEKAPISAEGESAVQPEYETYGNEGLESSGSASTIVERVTAEDRFTWKGLFGLSWMPVSLNPKYGILPLILGSFKVAMIAILIAAPIGVLCAIFTAMFASKGLKEVMKPVIEILAGFPSVVIGFIALVILASQLQNLFGFQYRLNAFTGGVALSLTVIPIIFTISDDALSTVPKSLIEASLALGASKWETVFFVALPAALPGIFAAVLLGIGRAVGETMIVLMATGNAALFTFSAVDPVRTLSATIGAEMAEVVFGDTHYSVLFIIGVLLFIFSFLLNMTAEVFVRDRLMRRFRGA